MKTGRGLFALTIVASIGFHAVLAFGVFHGGDRPAGGGRTLSVSMSIPKPASDPRAEKQQAAVVQRRPEPRPAEAPAPAPEAALPPEMDAQPQAEAPQEATAATPGESAEESAGGQGPGGDAGAGNPVAVAPNPPKFLPFYKVDTKPDYAYRAPLTYPPVERQLKREGRVVIEADIDENGNLVDARVQQSAGPAFDEAALAWVLASRFTPAKSQGKQVPVRMIIPVEFTLEE